MSPQAELKYYCTGIVRACTSEGIDISAISYSEAGRTCYFYFIGKRCKDATGGISWSLVVPKELATFCTPMDQSDICRCEQAIQDVQSFQRSDSWYSWEKTAPLDSTQHRCRRQN